MLNKKKINTFFALITIVLIVGIPRILSVNKGLPYNQFWDEPLITQGALNGLKNIFDGDKYTNLLAQDSEVVYGGFLRYTVMLQDAIYYMYVWATDPGVYTLADIKTNLQGQQVLTTSHPGFYYWNRVYHASISILAFVFVFLLLRKLYGLGYGIIGALLLGLNVYYFSQSYIFVANVPLGTMMIASIYFAVQYEYTKRFKYLIWSLIFSGIAFATKMTGAATLLVPFIVGLANFNRLKEDTSLKTIKKAILLGLIPLSVFVLFTPSIIFNSSNFFYWVGWLSDLYKAGGDHAQMEPGMEHLMFQFNLLIRNQGLIFIILALIGAITGLAGINNLKGERKEHLVVTTLLLVLFPLLYLFYVTFQYKISYHRNFIFYYPILSVLTSMGVAFVVNSICAFSPKILIYKNWIKAFVIGIIIYTGLPNIKQIYASSLVNHKAKDSRSRILKEFISNTPKPFHLGIENGLKISDADIADIRYSTMSFDIGELDTALLGFSHLLVSDYQFKHDDLQAFPDSIVGWIEKELNKNVLYNIPGEKIDYYHHLALWTPIVDPAVRIIKASDYPPPLLDYYLAPIFSYNQFSVLDAKEDRLFIGLIESGDYELKYTVSGTMALEEYPRIAIMMNNELLDSVQTTDNRTGHTNLIKIEEATKVELTVRILNDYWDADTGEDRNAFLNSLSLKKKRKNND